MADEPEPEHAPEPSPVERALRRRRRAASPPVEPVTPTEDDAPRQVRRARRERVVGGVCGGIARAFGFDPNLLRAVTVLLAFAGGAGLVAYLAALFLMPLEPRPGLPRTPPDLPRPDWGLFWIGSAFVALSWLALARVDRLGFRLFTLERGGLWALGLALLTLWLSSRAGRALPASAGATPRPLLRPRRDRVLLGVAAGFARHAAIDVSLVRVGLLVMAVWSLGLGVVFYLAVAAFLPCDRPAR